MGEVAGGMSYRGRVPGNTRNTANVGEAGKSTLSRVLAHEAVGPIGAGHRRHGAARVVVAAVKGDYTGQVSIFMAVVFVCRWRAPGRGRRRQGAIPETAEAEARRAKAEERVENFILVVGLGLL